MLRAILGGVVILAIAAGCQRTPTTSSAEQKGPRRGAGTRGVIERVDPVAGTLTVQIRSRQNPAVEKTFQVEDDTLITSFLGENKTELRGKAGLSDPQFKQGSRVQITSSEDGSKAVSIQVGDLPRRGRNRGGQGPQPAPQ